MSAVAQLSGRPKLLHKCRGSFPGYAGAFWTVPTKSKGMQRVILTPAQRLVWAEYQRQMAARGFVRLNLLKCRQVGGSTFCRLLGLHHCLTRRAVAALSIAHEEGLPTEWLGLCAANWAQTPEIVRPTKEPARRSTVLRFGNGSSYGIGSAQGGFPGMGHTISFLHVSEIGRWDKSPIKVDPHAVLLPLDPAIPTGEDRYGTVQIFESTGVMVGDHWNRRWTDAKADDTEFMNIFLPWFLVTEYRREDLAGGVLSLTRYERDTRSRAKAYNIDLSHAQVAWRRDRLRQPPYSGHEDEFKAEYPGSEDEAFMAPGKAIYTAEEVEIARGTVREPIWRGNITRLGAPSVWESTPNDSGEMQVWEWPDERYHYVLGADCQWGKKKDADWDVLYVECLETGRICAKVKGHYPLNIWGRKIAAVGFKYNTCPVAPELNGQDAASGQAVMPLLLGNVEDWSYPNIWVRSDPDKLRGYKAQDYGWWTDTHSKSNAIAVSESLTLAHDYDWCDSTCVDQMQTIIRHEDNTLGAPEGMNDDEWMARIITGAVAHRERPRTSLWVEPQPKVFRMRTAGERVKEHLGE